MNEMGKEEEEWDGWEGRKMNRRDGKRRMKIGKRRRKKRRGLNINKYM